MTKPPLSDGPTYNRADLRRQLDWYEATFAMTSQEHCDRRDNWLTDRGPHPIPSARHMSWEWDSLYHEWEELG